MISLQTPSGKKNLILRGIRTPSGNRTIAAGSILTPDGDYQFWDNVLPALSVTKFPAFCTGAIGSAVPLPITTNAVGVSPSGGSPPYTYAWTQESGTPGWGISSPSSPSSSFTSHPVNSGSGMSATFRCTVTDSRGSTGYVEVDATVVNYGNA